MSLTEKNELISWERVLPLLPQPALICKPDGTIRFANDPAARFFEKADEALIGQHLESLFSAPIGSFHPYLNPRNEASSIRFDVPVNHPAGKTLHSSVTICHLPESPTSLVFLQDVTALRRSESQLKLLTSAIRYMQEAILITDSNIEGAGPRILFVNEAACRLTGYAADELLAQPISILYGPRTSLAEIRTFRETMIAGKPGTVEAIYYRKDESEFVCNWSISPIHDDNNQISQWVSIHRDFTEQRRREEELQHSRKLRAVGEMAGGFAHEFKNLLTPMLLQMEELSDALQSRDDLLSDIKVVQDTISKARDLSERLLVLGRKSPVLYEKIPIGPLVDETLALVRKTIDRRIDVVKRCTNGLGPVVVSRVAFSQVALNLIFNARDTLMEKLQSPHAPAWIPRITLALDRTTATPPPSSGLPSTEIVCQRLAVEDNGRGIPPELCERIFEPFFTTKGPSKGTGLGLSLVWNLVNSMGGWIQVQSVPGIGTRMLVFLPENREQPKNDEPVKAIFKTSQKEPEGLRVLLVEDEPLVARAFTTPLRKKGHQVVPAPTARDGIEYLRKDLKAFDLVISDINMPQMDGIEFITRVRQLGFAGKIMVVTGYVSDEDRDRLESAGVNLILIKPLSREELLSAVASVFVEDAPAPGDVAAVKRDNA